MEAAMNDTSASCVYSGCGAVGSTM